MKIDDILDVVCEVTGVEKRATFLVTRKEEIVFARMLTMHLSSKYGLGKLSFIGKYFNNKDHATVVHANNKFTRKFPYAFRTYQVDYYNEVVKIVDDMANKSF